tara:strand:+ start:352 stop:939 length:588 start_codon:yes stop_codon:yes gene_type:complete
MSKLMDSAKHYRNALCEVLDISIDALTGKSRVTPLPIKRQIVSTFIEQKFGSQISMKSLAIDLMNYKTEGAHSMVIYNRKQVLNGLEYNNKKMIYWHQIALEFTDQYNLENRPVENLQAKASKIKNPEIAILPIKAALPVEPEPEQQLNFYIPTHQGKLKGLIMKKKLMRGMLLIWSLTLLLIGQMIYQIIQDVY